MKKNKVIEAIKNIAELAKDSQFVIKKNEDLKALMHFFCTSERQTILLAIIFFLASDNEPITGSSLVRYLSLPPLNLLYVLLDLEALVMLKIVKVGYQIEKDSLSKEYAIRSYIIQAVLKNEKKLILKSMKCKTDVDFLERIYSDSGFYDAWDAAFRENLKEIFRELINHNKNLKIVKFLLGIKSEVDSFVLAILIWQTLSGYKSSNLETVIGRYYGDSNEGRKNVIKYCQYFLKEQTDLQKRDFARLCSSSLIKELDATLGQTAVDMLKNIGIVIESINPKVRRSSIVTYESIIKKPLFYNPDNLEKLEMISKLLQPAEYRNVQGRLEQQNISKSICILLTGKPGVGKTEFSYQISLKTKRDLFFVNISSAKSMFYGRTEQKIKEIFSEYFNYVQVLKKSNGNTPILFLDECDSLMMRRVHLQNNSDTSSQVSNTVQNIILQEIEKNTDMILIASTNLQENMDKAFSRRFLFKIPLDQPNINTRKLIWKSKENLKLTACEIDIVAEFELSPAQIENINRKASVKYVIDGEVTFSDIRNFCHEEAMTTSKTTPIGFNNNKLIN
jgi:hypothetical protein